MEKQLWYVSAAGEAGFVGACFVLSDDEDGAVLRAVELMNDKSADSYAALPVPKGYEHHARAEDLDRKLSKAEMVEIYQAQPVTGKQADRIGMSETKVYYQEGQP